MHITNLSITSPASLSFELDCACPIVFFRGRYSSLALDLVRELIGDRGYREDPDRVDDGRFVIHSDIDFDSKCFSVCYIRNADFLGDRRLAVNFSDKATTFSVDDTRLFIEKCNSLAVDNSNVLRKTASIEKSLDIRPIFIYDYFDRLDEATPISQTITHLASLGRQVFVAVCKGYPTDRLWGKNVQIIDTENE